MTDKLGISESEIKIRQSDEKATLKTLGEEIAQECHTCTKHLLESDKTRNCTGFPESDKPEGESQHPWYCYIESGRFTQ